MNKKGNAYSIHYSCSGMYNGGAVAPSICCIAIYNVKTKKMHSFSLDKYLSENKSLMDAEKSLLIDFIEFFNKISDAFFVHWEMGKENFGFKPIWARCANFGINNFEIGTLDTFDIKSYYYNCTDTTLIEALEEDECSRVTVLSPKSEIIGFNKGNFRLVALSTEAKAMGIADLFKICTESPMCTDEDSDIVKEIESLINTASGIRLYKSLCWVSNSQDIILEIIKILKTDADKDYLFEIIENGEIRNIRLLKFLALEYANEKYNVQVS